ncbi:MAG: indole-3-glycerol phosphate synthase TrpC [Bacillota bacterium]
MILEKILENKRTEVNALKKAFDYHSAKQSIDMLPPARSLSRSLKQSGKVTLLAEIKGASPSKGTIRKNFNPSDVARIYAENGAAAISVLTDEKFFSGRPEYLTEVRKATELPVLRKDFIIDPIQIYQARLLGADAVLLICSALSSKDLGSLMKAAEESGLEALVEVHDEYELDSAIKAGAINIGINNRDLRTFVTDINTTIKLSKKLGNSSTVLVSESGIKSRADIEMLKEHGVSAVLVGEALMAAADIAGKVRELTGNH